MVRTTLFDFIVEKQKQQPPENMNEVIYFSNHETAWRNACEIAGTDPDELKNKKFERVKKRRKK